MRGLAQKLLTPKRETGGKPLTAHPGFALHGVFVLLCDVFRLAGAHDTERQPRKMRPRRILLRPRPSFPLCGLRVLVRSLRSPVTSRFEHAVELTQEMRHRSAGKALSLRPRDRRWR